MSFSKTVRSLLTLLLVSLPAVLVPRVDAQVLRPAKKQTGVVNAADPATTAINPDVIALRTSSDLIMRDLGFNGKGELTFELRNRGDVPINPGGPGTIAAEAVVAKAPPVPENEQIKVTVYLNNAPFRTVFQPRLGGKKSKTFILAVPENLRPRCTQARPLKTVIDPNNVIVELTDTNNVDTVTAVRPCPDLAIESIKKNWNDNKTAFVARVTLVNKGNAEAPPFEFMSQAQNNSAFSALPDFGDDTGGPLAPGATKKYNVGSAFGYEKMWVRVWLDRRGFIEELDESNNLKEKVLD